MDILLTEMWLPQLFQSSGEDASGGINEYFEENGFGSKTLIINLGSTFVYIAVYFFLCFLYLLVFLLSTLSER